MHVHTSLADSAADAVAQIRAQLGPQAVVLNVRPLPGEGLARLWQKRRIEVLACLPDVDTQSLAGPANFPQEPGDARPGLAGAPAPKSSPETGAPAPDWRLDLISNAPVGPSLAQGGAWRVGAFLQTSGLLPIHAERVVDELRELHGDNPPPSLGKEMGLAASLLRTLWPWPERRPAEPPAPATHVLIGAPGVGKTVGLCKWLAQAVLVEGRTATVWRLDGRTANTAGALSVYAEILNVPLERSLPADRHIASDLLFVDVPGVAWNDGHALDELAGLVGQLSRPQVHLCLNAAYESALLLSQVRAFSKLPVADLIVTHLDEETRWGKLWNLALGTNLPLRFLSAGQNVPGDWIAATPEAILARQFPAK